MGLVPSDLEVGADTTSFTLLVNARHDLAGIERTSTQTVG
jgi:hypothetical protein